MSDFANAPGPVHLPLPFWLAEQRAAAMLTDAKIAALKAPATGQDE
ncbi:hypothetical protein [Novosphingobium sp. MMS21-SN21R]|nr:hypothetical protein [Novosphingobium sp. MMS21-SN21R]MDT0508602.1 hypothetical protein [Novosphingobium sp. MMS21-SN21R]